jgi:hypothetical protein
MNRIYNFLESLSDKELAYFIKFKKTKYSVETQKIIDDYIQEKNFTQEKIERLVELKFFASKDQTQVCPRCGSFKFLVNSVEWTDNIGKPGINDDVAVSESIFLNKITRKDEIICNVCDYWVQDPNNRGPKKKLSGYSIWNILDWLLD